MSNNPEFTFPVGEFHLSAGNATPLMDATFSYSQPPWRPETDYTVKGKRGYLVMKVPVSMKNLKDGDNNKWDISLSKDLPLDLEIDMGVGQGHFDLGGLTLGRVDLEVGIGEYHIDLAGSSPAKVEIDSGIGEVEIDLSGPWSNDLSANIRSGLGELTLVLPRGVGVRVEVTGLLGSVEAGGFARDGDIYTNDVYGESEHTLHISVARGIGGVGLKLAE